MPFLALATIAAACGGSDGGGEPTESSLRAAATRNAEALLDREWRTAYDGFSAACREQVSYSEFVGQMTVAIAFAEAFLGMKWDDLELEDVTIESFTPEEAAVRVRIVGPGDEDFTDESEDADRWLFEEGEWRLDSCEDLGDDEGGFDDDEGGGTPSATPATGPGSSRAEPAPIGTAVRIAGWDVRVLSVEPDGSEIVLADSFNDPPAAGNQFFLVEIEATYVGEEESSTFFFDVTLKALGPSNVAYDSNADCGFFEGELDDTRDVFRGGTIRGYVCWEVSASDAVSLLMYAEPGFGFEQSDRRWWSLTK